jgi:hypothetical protein
MSAPAPLPAFPPLATEFRAEARLLLAIANLVERIESEDSTTRIVTAVQELSIAVEAVDLWSTPYQYPPNHAIAQTLTAAKRFLASLFRTPDARVMQRHELFPEGGPDRVAPVVTVRPSPTPARAPRGRADGASHRGGR